MNPPDTMLEQRISDAFAELADSLPFSTGALAETRLPRRRSPRWRGALVAAAVVAVLVAGVAVTRPFASDDAPPSSPVTTTTPPTPSTTVPAAIVGLQAPEIPLTIADTEDTQFLIRMRQRQEPASHPFAVQIPGRAAVVVTGPCMTIAEAPVFDAGYQGSCAGRDPATQIVQTIDTGSTRLPTSITYGAWLGVPDGATYVTFTYGELVGWQRPIRGVSYFTTPGAGPTLGPEPAVFRAFDDAGRQLGEARAQPYQQPDGSWGWY